MKWPEVPLPVAPRAVLNASATDAMDTQASVAAENAPLRIIYGQVRLGPLIACVLPYLAGLVILAVWGHGECDSVVSYTVDDKDPPAGVTATHYMGTAGQTADATLVAAFTANAKTYTDTLAGICYSVFYVPAGASSGFPRINAILKGRKIATGADGSTVAWSDNPAYCLADFITNTAYGCKRSVNWASVYSVALDCDALVGTTVTEKTRTLNLAMDTVQPVSNWLETLRTYAGCWVIQTGADYKLVSDKAGSSVAAIDHEPVDLSVAGPVSAPTDASVTVGDGVTWSVT